MFPLCTILEKYQLLSFENLKVFKTSCLIYSSMNGMAPPPLGGFIKKRNSEASTRSTIRGIVKYNLESLLLHKRPFY